MVLRMEVEASSTSANGGGGGGNKRRKTGDASSIHPNPGTASAAADAVAFIGIADLTADNLSVVGDYLPRTSRALLAAALTAPPSSWREGGFKGTPVAASAAVVSSVRSRSPPASIVEGLCRERADAMEPRCSGWPVRVPRCRPTHRGPRENRPYPLTVGRNIKAGPPVKNDDFFREGLVEQLEDYYEQDGWEVLDFADLEQTLASRLTDDDLGAILVCIDAKKNLKRLNLTRCFNVVGHGLEPIRHSTTIEKIDMGLARQIEMPNRYDPNHYYEMFPEDRISPEVVFDILDDIIDNEGRSFRRFQYPCKLGKWPRSVSMTGQSHPSPTDEFLEFLSKHEHVLNTRSGCVYFGPEVEEMDPKDFIAQLGDSTDLTDSCILCANISMFEVCIDCSRALCRHCQGWDMTHCQSCGSMSCCPCVELSQNSVKECDSKKCSLLNCEECRLVDCKSGEISCQSCQGMCFDRMFHENVEKQAKIERLQKTVAELTRRCEKEEGDQDVISNNDADEDSMEGEGEMSGSES